MCERLSLRLGLRLYSSFEQHIRTASIIWVRSRWSIHLRTATVVLVGFRRYRSSIICLMCERLSSRLGLRLHGSCATSIQRQKCRTYCRRPINRSWSICPTCAGCAASEKRRWRWTIWGLLLSIFWQLQDGSQYVRDAEQSGVFCCQL